jgi:curved DNA-binding protein CbpA
MDYYEIMGFVDRIDMNIDTLKSNYKKLVVVFHPDKLCNKNQTEKN